MKRHAESYLKEWIKQKKRKPLVLRGARQVGKSTLVRMFAKNERLSLVEVNFETVNFRSLKTETLEFAEFVNEIEVKFKTTLSKGIVLFLDEIQKSPEAFMMLRYFYEKMPELPVIAAGSLLEFLFDEENISVPVGRIEYYHLGPMTFGEFLLALGEEKLFSALNDKDEKIKPSVFESLQKRVHEYLFVGGMPEAVLKFIENGKAEDVRKIQRSIVDTYQNDFPKYAKKSKFEKVNFVFSRIHLFIGKKIKYSELSTEYQSKDIRLAIELLEKARIVTRCFHSNASDISLYGTQDLMTFKVYFLDVGLLNCILKTPWADLRYLYSMNSVLKGLFYEQFIAQHLAYSSNGQESPILFYWLRDKKSNLAEVDFLIQIENKIYPIEVKSGAATKLKSLNQIMGQRGFKKAIRFSVDERILKNSREELSTFYFDGPKKKSVKYLLYNLHLSQVEFLTFLNRTRASPQT